MAETLAAPKTWANPEHVTYIVGEIRRHKKLSRLSYSYPGPNGQPATLAHTTTPEERFIDPFEVQEGCEEKICKLADRIQDEYLREGIVGLYLNWDAFGNHLLTPRSARQPIAETEAYWGCLPACIGSVCLAARAADGVVAVTFGGVALAATPETLPAELYREYDTISRTQQAALQASQASF